MSLIFLEGFETYSGSTIPAALSKKWSSITGTSSHLAIVSGGRINTSGNYLQTSISGQSGYVEHSIPSNNTTLVIGFACKISATPPAFNNPGKFLAINGSNFLYPTNTSDPTQWVMAGGNASVTMTGFTFGAWHYIEVRLVYISGAFWTITVKCNGATVYPAGGVSTSFGSATSVGFGNSINSGAVTVGFDDIYICDGAGSVNNDFITNASAYTIEGITPNAAGNYSQWTSSTAGNHYDNVSVDDGDTSYISSAVIGNIDSYGCSNLSVINGAIAGVQLSTVTKTALGTAVTLRQITRSGGTDYTAGDFTGITSNYSAQNTILETDPATSAAWTVSGVNALEVGIKYQA